MTVIACDDEVMPVQKSFVREKTYYCGKQYKEVDIYNYTSNQAQAVSGVKRSKKKKESAPKQKNLNEKNARRYFLRLVEMNFGGDPEAMHVSPTYKDKFLPASIEEAEREAYNYLRRVAYLRKKKGLPPLKYILVTACVVRKSSGKIVRIHHHILMNGGLDRDEVENLWRKRKEKGQKQGEKIGYCNADRLQSEDGGLAALAEYLTGHMGGKKKWSTSHNLDRPTKQTADGKYTARQLNKWARERPGPDFWRRKYPGWEPEPGENGVKYEYNELTGWAIYLKLRRRE